MNECFNFVNIDVVFEPVSNSNKTVNIVKTI